MSSTWSMVSRLPDGFAPAGSGLRKRHRSSARVNGSRFESLGSGLDTTEV
ncbi:hypothetical protein [Streptomyces enissocaesilis]